MIVGVGLAASIGSGSGSLAVACLREHHDCTSFTVCALGRTCGNAGPHGTWTCGQAAQCEGGCGNDQACACRCAENTRRASAQALFLLDVCALLCKGDGSCIANQCGGPLARCAHE